LNVISLSIQTRLNSTAYKLVIDIQYLPPSQNKAHW